MLLLVRGAELGVGQVAELTGLAQPRASEQPAELKRGGILAFRKDGKIVLYRADKQAAPPRSPNCRRTAADQPRSLAHDVRAGCSPS